MRLIAYNKEPLHSDDPRILAGQRTYIASPWAKLSAREWPESVIQVKLACKALMHLGVPAFSPILYSHQFDNEFLDRVWMWWDQHFMDTCTYMVIVPIKGWQDSEGIRKEIAEFSPGHVFVLDRHMTVDENSW